MTYSFHPDAEAELNASVDYYEECQINLGVEFAHEVYKTIQRIIEFPSAWRKLDDKIIILAVMQLQRKPNYWKSRKI